MDSAAFADKDFKMLSEGFHPEKEDNPFVPPDDSDEAKEE